MHLKKITKITKKVGKTLKQVVEKEALMKLWFCALFNNEITKFGLKVVVQKEALMKLWFCALFNNETTKVGLKVVQNEAFNETMILCFIQNCSYFHL